jgi:uncharacterized protein with beta-barrel porin domain
MYYRPFLPRVLAFFRSPYAWTLILSLLLLLPGSAHAASCPDYTVPDANTTPSTSPMAANGTIVINVSACNPSGIGINPLTATTAHGQVTADSVNAKLTYVNNGDGALTDSFDFPDADNVFHHVTVNIGAATSPITVSPGSLPTPAVGTAYNQSLSATGGTAPYTFSLASGTLPRGLTMSGGVISGTPNQAGAFSFSISVADSASLTGTKSYSVTVPDPSNGIVVAAVPNANLNSPYNITLSASGATGPYTFTLESGALPTSLTLTNGVISGVPTILGTYNFSIRATDSSPAPGPYFHVTNLSIVVQNVPPTAGPVSATVAYGSTNNPISLNITGATATSVAISTAASHGSAVASGTSITYTPTTGFAGADSFFYTASNGVGPSSPAKVTVTISPPTIVFTPTAPPSPTAGVPYSHSIANASGGTGPYTYTVSTGSLPAGLTLAANGTIAGTPKATGTFTVKVIATDSTAGTGPFASTPANVTLTINPPLIVLTPATLPDGNVNASYSQGLVGSGGTSTYSYALQTGTLPTGMSLDSSGLLHGTPTQAGSFPITVTATDSTTGPAAPYSGSQAYTLVIAAPTITMTPPTIRHGTVGTDYGIVTVAAAESGYTGAFTFTTNPANMPPGLTLASSGTISGTPTTSGDYTFTVTATDTNAFFGTKTYTLHIDAILPGAPGIGAAIAGDGQASVSFTPPANTGGAPITGYIVTDNTGSHTGTGASSPITVNGLTNGTPYTFTVAATNIAGPGPASVESNPAVTPKGAQTISFTNPPTQTFGTPLTLVGSSTSGLTVTFTSLTTSVCTVSGNTVTFPSAGTCTINADQGGGPAFLAASTVQRSFQVNALVPDAPAITAVTAGDGQAQVTFTAPASNGGAGIIDYTATASPGGAVAVSTSAGSITVTHLTNGTPYTFTVTARNTAGNTTSPPFGPATPQGVQTIMFTQGQVNFGVGTTQLTASTNAGLPVAYTSTTPNVCTVTPQGALTTVRPGNCTIDANQDAAGHPEWKAAPQVEQTFLIFVPGGAVMLPTTAPTVGTGGTPYTFTFNASGGASPYTYTETGALPTGLTMTPAGTISGVPTSSGTYPITVTVTDSATQTAQKTYQLTINAPGIALAPATLPQGQAGAVYAPAALSASGGSAPYTYSITSGALPPGLTMTPAGVISGTPTSAASFNITVTATDKFNFQGSQAYTLAVGQPVPISVNYAATVNANGSVSMPVTTVDTGPFTSLAITQQPAHGTATVNGLNIVYTPTHDYFGSDTLKYTATGPGGTSAPATVNITVTAGAVPVATAQAATVVAGKSVTIHAATGATNGPFTALTLTGMPATGTATVTGTDILYTADPSGSGIVGIDFTLTNAFGVSQPAHVAVTVNARPVAQNLTASVIAGTTVKVDLTTTAHGGPFTDAKLVSISPANAGSATVQASANGGYSLSFTAAPTFGGMAQVSYTLSNAFATSDPASIAVSVTARSDPSKDAEVLGVLDAQADSTRRMATGQISNFQRRLESLHGSGSVGGFSNGISMSSASTLRNPDTLAGIQGAMDDQGRNYLVAPEGQPAGSRIASSATGTGAAPGDIAFWTGGAVNFGKTQPGTSDNGIDFTTSGLSVGADKQVASKLTVGVGLGYGHDMSDVGQHGSRSTVDSYNVAIYGSYQPTDSTYVDAVLGYQWLNFDARRYVTDNGAMVHGSRDGKQYFGSFSVGYQHQTDDMMVTPYGRLDIARASLDSYTESGDPIFALAYQDQTVKTATATLGMLAQWTAKRDYGTWAPQLRAEFGHDMQGSSQAVMRYADLLSGPLYQATLTGLSRNHTMLGAGISLATLNGWLLRAEYQNYLDNSTRDNQSILLGVEKKFGP